MRIPRYIFYAYLVLACTSPVDAHKESPWIEVRSPHFCVVTNGSEGAARRVAREFEQVRSVFATGFANMRLETGAPLLIFAPRDEVSMKHLVPARWKRNHEHIAGYFEHGWERQFAVIRLDQDIPGAYQVVYHEYTHTLLHANSHWLPTWLDEGLADYYGGTRFEATKIYVGAPILRVEAMRSQVSIPLEEFITMNPYVKYHGDDQRIDLFYAESWALVHYCIFGEGMEQGKKLAQFFQKIETGVDQKKAFVESFGSFESMQKNLDVYVRKFLFSSYVMANPPQIHEKEFAARKMSVAETEAAIAGYRLWDHDVPEAKELIDEALGEDPKLAEAHEYKGFLYFHEGKDEEAAKEFTLAYELDPTRYLSLYYSTMLSPFAWSDKPEDRHKLREALSKILKINPQFGQAYVQLALWQVRQGDLTTALAVARHAEQLEPSRAGYHLLSARILQRLGRNKQAAEFSQFVAERWQGPDHDEAVELWKQLPREDRPAGIELSESTLNGANSAEGKVVSTTCGQENEGISVTIESQGKNQTFRAKGGFSVGFSDTLWYGTDHFQLCHHLNGLRAVVRYKPTSDTSFAGDLVELELREDLPNSAAGKIAKDAEAHE